MALIREVLQSDVSKKWAYIEHSDENENHFIVLGGEEFDTKEKAEEWKKGFAPDSYEWKDPKGKGQPLMVVDGNNPKVVLHGRVIGEVKSIPKQNKPPIGIMPKKLWLENRFLEVKEAIKRYMDANLCVPDEWNKEYNWLIEQLKNEHIEA